MVKIPENRRLVPILDWDPSMCNASGACTVIAPQPEPPKYIAKKQQQNGNEGRAELKIFRHTEKLTFLKEPLGGIIRHESDGENKGQK